MKTTLLTSLVALALLAATAVVSAHDEPPVTNPPEASSPTDAAATVSDEPMPVAGPDGEWIRCPDGQLLKASLLDWLKAPNVGESVQIAGDESGETSYRVTEPVVARCGPEGGGADAQPIFVPESVGKHHLVAPRRYVRAQAR
jgi:hypothetical protein